jgi:uncharacterized protein YlxW (UPF0749 family)
MSTVEPGPETPTGDHPSGLLHPRRTPRQVVAALLLAALGFGLVVQVRATQDAGLSSLRQSDLIRILDDVTERSARLQAETRELERTRDRLRSSSDGRRTALEETRKRAETLGILAGTLPATGPGIEILIPDPKASVGPLLLLDAVQELRDAGAEAMQISDVRVVASTDFTEAEGSILIDGQPVTAPYRVLAIGEPAALATALRIPGGVVETLGEQGSAATVTERDQLTVSALHAVTAPEYARPAP